MTRSSIALSLATALAACGGSAPGSVTWGAANDDLASAPSARRDPASTARRFRLPGDPAWVPPEQAGIVAVTPDVVEAGGGTVLLTVKVTGFLGPAATLWFDTTPIPARYVPGWKYAAQVPASLVEEGGIHVIHVKGYADTGLAFFTVRNPAPALYGASETSLVAYSPFDVDLAGARLVPGVRARINDFVVPLTFVSDGSAHLHSPGLAVGDYSVVLENPGPGGGLSESSIVLHFAGTPPAGSGEAL